MVELRIVKKIIRGYSKIQTGWRLGRRNGRWNLIRTPEIMHCGRSNACRNYTVNGRTLRNIDRQRDLGVHVHQSLKVATQVDKESRRHTACLPSSVEALNIKIGR